MPHTIATASDAEATSPRFTGSAFRSTALTRTSADDAATGTSGRGVPLAREDFELLPTLWRNPDRVTKGHSGNDILELDTLDGSTLVMIHRRLHGPLTVYKKSAGSI